MNTRPFVPKSSQAAQVLQAIVRAVSFADQECNNIQAASDWLTLIEAAACHAHFLLTDEQPDIQQAGES
jgi:hypothetical protein